MFWLSQSEQCVLTTKLTFHFVYTLLWMYILVFFPASSYQCCAKTLFEVHSENYWKSFISKQIQHSTNSAIWFPQHFISLHFQLLFWKTDVELLIKVHNGCICICKLALIAMCLNGVRGCVSRFVGCCDVININQVKRVKWTSHNI